MSKEPRHRVTTPAPPVDLSKLSASVDHLAKSSDELRATIVELSTQNHELKQRVELMQQHNPDSVDYAEHHSANVSAQSICDDLAAKLDASATAMSETAQANKPDPLPAPKKTEPNVQAA